MRLSFILACFVHLNKTVMIQFLSIFVEVVLMRENQFESQDLWWIKRQGWSLAHT